MSEQPPRDSLKDLTDRLERFRTETQPPERKAAVGEPTTGMGLAFTITAHLVTGLAGGAAIGVLLDRWLGTSPWCLVVFFFLGAAAGFLNVYRTVTGMGMALGYHPAPSKPEDERHKQRRPTDAGDQQQQGHKGGNQRGQSTPSVRGPDAHSD